MKFYHLLLELNDTIKAEHLLFGQMRSLGHSLKNNWTRKENSFLKLIKYPNILKNKDVIKTNIVKFMLVLNQCLFNFIYKINNKEPENLNKLDDNTLFRFKSINLNALNSLTGLNAIDSNLSSASSNKNNEVSNIFSNNFSNYNSNNTNNSGSQSYSNNIFNLNKSPSDINSQENESGSIYWNHNQNEECRQNLEEVKDLSRFSTKEEFSDFEDEIQLHENCINVNAENLCIENNINLTSPSKSFLNSHNNISNVNNINFPSITCNPTGSTIKQDFLKFIENQNANPIMNPINLQINKTNKSGITYDNTKNSFSDYLIKNNNNIPTNSQNNNMKLDKNSNYNVYSKDYIPKKKCEESWKNKLPMLKSFTPKYTKRENIDKKILRKFKTYLKDNHREKKLKNISQDKHFWLMFINGNLFPPINFQDNNTGEHIDFKSFNTKFMLWFFSKKGAKELYDIFMKEQSNSVLNSICEDYQVTKMEEIAPLNTYINNLAYIFDIGALEHGDKLLNSPPEPQKNSSTKSSQEKKFTKSSFTINSNVEALNSNFYNNKNIPNPSSYK
jgi:hypothetical protein